MSQRHNFSNRSAHRSEAGTGGLLLGVLAIVAGTTWCLKNHGRSSSGLTPGHSRSLRQHQRVPGSSVLGTESHHKNWLLGALGVSAGLAGAALGASRHRSGNGHAYGQARDVHLSSSVTINRSPEEVYQYWRQFQNLPQVMSFIERVEPQEGNIYHWVARGPAGPAIEWDAEVVDDDPGKMLAWRSIEGSDLQTWGTVIFRPRQPNRGTEVSVAFNFCPPARATGAIARYLSGLENAALDKNLKNLKAKLEAGEVPTSRRHSTNRGHAS